MVVSWLVCEVFVGPSHIKIKKSPILISTEVEPDGLVRMDAILMPFARADG